MVDNTRVVEADRLLLSVAEHLKVPLTTIARHVELERLNGGATQLDASAIGLQADAALCLLDSYLLSLESMRDQMQLPLEPVSVSSLLADTAHDLYRFARQYGVTVELETSGKCGPVMGNARGLKAALLSLGFALVETQGLPPQGARRYRRLVVACKRAPQGVVAGMYGDANRMSEAAWRRALRLCGNANQPLAALYGSGAGLFVADVLLRAMQSHLKVGHFQGATGLTATLQASRQLQFV